MTTIDYSERIPNNVGLGEDRRLKRALEAWQPSFLDWWKQMGPDGLQSNDIYLRTATSVDTRGWAHFDYVKMPDYRWGIFLAEPEAERKIAFGEHASEPAWQEVPGEYRAALRRILVIQGDTEPASVEQQRKLGQTAPSLYDLRNLLQVNVEEGRHLWAMVYLLQAYFGRDGREEAGMLLNRRSGDPDKPRILGAFNEATPDWLSFFMFTYFTDRDGKFQLSSLAESAFDPLARTCRFMLKEEAHHMFVGETGIARIIERSCQVMREHPDKDPRTLGVIDLDLIQKHINFHFSVTLDLFGAEISTNAANGFSIGLKGRFQEERIADNHRLVDDSYPVLHPDDTRVVERHVPALNALNERLRDDFIADVERGISRWNKIIGSYGHEHRLSLPHRGFNRRIGLFADVNVSPAGDIIDESVWQSMEDGWLPSEADRSYVQSLMVEPVLTPGQFAHWIAPPARGINHQPLDFEYVRFD